MFSEVEPVLSWQEDMFVLTDIGSLCSIHHGYIFLTPQQRSRLANSSASTEGAGECSTSEKNRGQRLLRMNYNLPG
jgi:hypothetical protein